MAHLVLLGDSILDNGTYVEGGPAVIDQVREVLPDGWRASLLAVDGGTIADVPAQLAKLPKDATHLVLSVGGNDLLGEIDVLREPACTVGEALLMLAEVRDRFAAGYAELLRALRAIGPPAVVCTIYEPRFDDPAEQRAAVAALGLFDDAIVRSARAAGLPVIELRAVCTDDADFANPIEPSAAGGAKIARAIRDALLGHDDRGGRSGLDP